jgi:hypothetical protein
MSIRRGIAAGALLAAIASSDAIAQAQKPVPETVMVTLRVRPGAEASLADVIDRHWKTAQSLQLVLDAPHVTLRGGEADKPYYVEIFTWRDANIPDHAPAAIRAIWDEMNRLVERRDGKPGLELTEMFPVAAGRRR